MWESQGWRPWQHSINKCSVKPASPRRPPQYMPAVAKPSTRGCGVHRFRVRRGPQPVFWFAPQWKWKTMLKELYCRLIRNAVTSVVAILHASPLGKEAANPWKQEVRAMAQKIMEYYLMPHDPSSDLLYVIAIFKKLSGVGWGNRRNIFNIFIYWINCLIIYLPQPTVYCKLYKRLKNSHQE